MPNHSSSVLIITDMQNGFIRDGSRHVVPTVCDLVERWQAAGLSTVFTRFINRPKSPFERLIRWSRLQESPDIDLIDEISLLAAKAVAVIDKTFYSPFTAEGRALFNENGWTDLYFCGVATESCVLKGAVDAFELGLNPWVITDACASHAGQVAHDAGVLVVSRFIGRRQCIEASQLYDWIDSSAT